MITKEKEKIEEKNFRSLVIETLTRKWSSGSVFSSSLDDMRRTKVIEQMTKWEGERRYNNKRATAYQLNRNLAPNTHTYIRTRAHKEMWLPGCAFFYISDSD